MKFDLLWHLHRVDARIADPAPIAASRLHVMHARNVISYDRIGQYKQVRAPQPGFFGSLVIR